MKHTKNNAQRTPRPFSLLSWRGPIVYNWYCSSAPFSLSTSEPFCLFLNCRMPRNCAVLEKNKNGSNKLDAKVQTANKKKPKQRHMFCRKLKNHGNQNKNKKLVHILYCWCLINNVKNNVPGFNGSRCFEIAVRTLTGSLTVATRSANRFGTPCGWTGAYGPVYPYKFPVKTNSAAMDLRTSHSRGEARCRKLLLRLRCDFETHATFCYCLDTTLLCLST